MAPQTRPLAGFTAPLGRQQIELHEIEFDGGGTPLLRLRIREGSRFTVLDIDAVTAEKWGAAMSDWGARQIRQARGGE